MGLYRELETYPIAALFGTDERSHYGQATLGNSEAMRRPRQRLRPHRNSSRWVGLGRWSFSSFWWSRGLGFLSDSVSTADRQIACLVAADLTDEHLGVVVRALIAERHCDNDSACGRRRPVRMIAPAPTNPIPVTTCAATRLGSAPRLPAKPTPPAIVNRAAPRATRA